MNKQMWEARMAEKNRDWDFYEGSKPDEGAWPWHKIPQPDKVP